MHTEATEGLGAPEGASAEPRIVLYVRVGCHLCEQARLLVAEVAADTGAAWTEVDIEHGPDSDRLTGTYGELVPAVTVDGVQQGYWRLDAVRLRRALTGARA